MYSKISRLVGNNYKILKLFILIFIGAIIELISVGAILPALYLIVDSTDNDIFKNIEIFLDKINFLNNQSLVTIILIFLALIFILKFFYLMFLTYYQAIFGNKLRINLAKNFLKKYLTANYQFHVKNNSAFLIRNISGEIEVFYKSVFIPILTILMELIISVSIVLFLLVYSFKSTIIILIILSTLFIIYVMIVKKPFNKWGIDRQFHDGMKLKYLTQSLQFAKLIKFIKKEDFFIKKYLKHFFLNNLISQKFTVMLVFPRLFLELFLVLGLVITCIIFLSEGVELQYLFELLSIYVVAAYRIIPSITKLSISYQSIVTGKAALNKLVEILDTKINSDENNVLKQTFTQQIEIKNLSFYYENVHEKIFQNLNLKITKGNFIGIKGESGAGKSTLVDLLLGILKPNEGNIYLDGKKIEKQAILNLKIGYVPQDNIILDDTISNNIAIGINKDQIDNKKLDKAIELSNLKEFIKILPKGLETSLSEKGIRLSGGQRQRICIARSLYLEPEILILDEATSGIDIETEKKILEDLRRIKNLNTIILISHRKESMIYCDQIFELKNKKINKI